MEPIVISAIVLGATSLLSVIAKFIHSIRHDIKSCFGIIQFRTPENSNRNSPRQERIESDVIFPTETMRNTRRVEC